MVNKRKFIVAYDYGMGGLWGIVMARDEQEIEALFPELSIVDTPPPWMTPETLAGLHEKRTYDIDDAPRGLLSVILADRQS